MQRVLIPLREAIAQTLGELGVTELPEIGLQETPPGKDGDFGSPVALALARTLRRPPPALAAELAERMVPPAFVRRVFATGGYLNFELEPAFLLETALTPPPPTETQPGQVLLEHTSVNPNKELHVGHLRNVCLGDSLARILRQVGHRVQVLNYIDDTGRQAADSLFALQHYQLQYVGQPKYDHWVGEAYVRLHRELADPQVASSLEPRIAEVLHRLEAGELRPQVDRILQSQLDTMYRLGARYDLLVWESDLVHAGLLHRALDLLRQSPQVLQPTEGKYAGAMVIDASQLIPGLEDPFFVLVRSNGASTYYAKDIAFQLWKMGLLPGLGFETYRSERVWPGFAAGGALETSSPQGSDTRQGGATTTITVIDARQSHPQMIVRAGLEVAGRPDLAQQAHHLSYETVLLEGQQMSGRKGVTVSVDEVLDEARRRARAVIAEKNPHHPQPEQAAEQIAVGAIRFAMLRTEPRKQIDFRYDQALSFEGDTGPYVQYAHARASSILRKAEEQGLAHDPPNPDLASPLDLALARTLLRYGEATREAAQLRTPHLLAQYLLDLSSAWNTYYNARTPEGRPATVVLGAPNGLRGLRLALVFRLQQTLAQGLALLGIDAPEVM